MINSIVNTGLPQSTETPGSPIASAVSSAPSHTTETAASPSSGTKPSSAQISQAVTKLNDYVQTVQRNLSFSVDKASGETVIKVYDTQTNQVIQQIPAEVTLQLAAALNERSSQLLVKDKA